MITSKLGVRSALVSFALVVFGALGLAACAAPVAPEEEEAVSAGEEQVDSTQEALVPTCCYGSLTCPTTGHHYAWSTSSPSCPQIDPKYSVASAACNNACVDACTSVTLSCGEP